jgi:2-isopropylmalate synthase
MVGVPASNLVLGKHSGRHALRDRVKFLGYGEPDRDTLDRIYEAFTQMADNRKGLTNDDIRDLLDTLKIPPAEPVGSRAN